MGRIFPAPPDINPVVSVCVRMAENRTLARRMITAYGVPNLRGIEIPDVFPGVQSRCVGVVGRATTAVELNLRYPLFAL